MKKFNFLFCVLLSACSSNKLLYVNEYGVSVFQVNCSGAYNTIGKCYSEMAKQCPSGFNIINQVEQTVGSTYDEDTFGNYNTQAMTNAQANIIGNPYYANMFLNSNTYANTHVNKSTYGRQTNIIQRYIIYSCKNIN